MHLGDKIKEAGAIGYIFTLVTRDSDSNSAYYLFVARLHLGRGELISSALVRSGLGIVSHVSVESSRNKGARTAGYFRAFS